MSLGNPEDSISHDFKFEYCPECRRRGVNNRTELHSLGSIVCCGTCKQFLKGELDHDVPELKLYVRKMGQVPLASPATNFTPQPVYNEPHPTHQSQPDSATADIADWLTKNADSKLRKEIIRCLEEDKDSFFRILTDSKHFSLKELRRHAERLNKPSSELPLTDEQMETVLTKAKFRKRKIKVKLTEKELKRRRRKAEYARKYYHRKKEEAKCQSKNTHTTEKTTGTSSSPTEKELQKKAEIINSSLPTSQVTDNGLRTQNARKISKIPKERTNA